MTTKAYALSFLSVFHPGGTNLHPHHLLGPARTTIVDGYNSVSRYLARAAHRSAIPEEPAADELQDVHRSPGTDAAGDPNLEQPVHTRNPPHEHAFEASDREAAGYEASGGENDSAIEPLVRSRYTQMRLALMVVGALTLIVTPGLVLGTVTGQLLWGVALSGATATVVSFLAGLYYHLNR